jgi:SAM-dependent methyltransferase
VVDDRLAARFIRQGDPRVEEVAGAPLPPAWWSRPYEYAWAMGFCDPDAVALDAGCGVPHPFKAHLPCVCREAHACDTDPDAALVAALIPGLRFTLASVVDLPYGDGTFDRVFCISTLEHLGPDGRAGALREFGRVLRPGGLAVLTVDVPPVNLRALLDQADAAGLRPAGDVLDLDGPPAGAVYHEGWGLRVYRAALVRA